MSDSNKLVIFGAGETAMLAYEYFSKDTDLDPVCFCVDAPFIERSRQSVLPVIPSDDLLKSFPPEDFQMFVAIGSGNMNRYRRDALQKYRLLGYRFASYISSRAFVWDNALIGENCLILENNTIQPFVTIGDNVTLWSGNHIGHRTKIEDNVFVSSHCVISGFCTIKTNCFLGVNCTVEDEVIVEEDNFIGAGVCIRRSTRKRSVFQRKPDQPLAFDSHRAFKVK